MHVHPSETVRAAIAILQEYGVSQMPVVKAEPPLALAEVVGTVTDRDLLERLVADPTAVDTPVEAVMGPPLPMIGSGEPIDLAAARLADGAAVLVIDGGHPTGIVTRSDLLEFLSGAGPGPQARAPDDSGRAVSGGHGPPAERVRDRRRDGGGRRRAGPIDGPDGARAGSPDG